MAPSSPFCPHLRIFFLITILATLSTEAFLVFEDSDNPFSPFDCPSPPPSTHNNDTEKVSKFKDNVITLLEQLSSRAASTGFASLSSGNGTDRAFIRGLCSGNAIAGCKSCLQLAALDIDSRCNSNSSRSSSRRGVIWYNTCFLSYADTNASTSYEDTYRHVFYSSGEVADKAAFQKTYYELMSRLTARVVNGSGSGKPSPAPMFATGEAVFDRTAANGTMYGMLECMRDLSAAGCDKCLQTSVQQLPTCCYGHQGGVVLGYNCKLRVEIYPYYDLTLNQVDAPPPSFVPSFIQERQGKKGMHYVILKVALPVGILLVVVSIVVAVFSYKRKSRKRLRARDNHDNEEDISYVELEQFNISILRAATNNFSEERKLGEGGFGQVFQGTLQSGEEIAVKRLSKYSSQGIEELKNELVLAAKLKHRNLVQLLGVCLQEEKLLVYEYMPNRSLDTILFDPAEQQQLDWSKRLMIVRGIARGLLYLHEESCLKVIHRDLKPSNVLLDADLNPKISDFGLARAFVGDQSRDVTRRPVGTLGYMSPEYAYCGHVSSKSDMFSFGVIVLEMVTGRRRNSSYECFDSASLLSYVWEKWRTGLAAEVVDPSLRGREHYDESEVFNCIEIGLLCVQENPTERPDASTVVVMLKGQSKPDEPRRVLSRPGFFFGLGQSSDAVLVGNRWPYTVSGNEVTISDFLPR